MYAIRIDGRWKMPEFQFDEDRLVPNISAVNEVLPVSLDPVSVLRFYTSPDPELEGPSGMHSNAAAMVFNERAEASGATPAHPCFHRALGDPAMLTLLKNAARRLGYVLN